MNYKIFADENIPFLANALRHTVNFTQFKGRELNRSKLSESGCNILFVRSTTKVNEELLHGTDVKFVATATSGTDHIDEEYLSGKGIAFYSAAGSNANSVAEYVVYSILKWAGLRNFDLNEKSIGIIGYGNIGRQVAKYCQLLGLKVYVNDPPLTDAGLLFPHSVNPIRLHDLLRLSDIITNHVPLNPYGKYKTIGLLGKKEIDLVKENSLIIHASRGGIADEQALIGLNAMGINLVIDTWANEPIVNTSLAADCLLATPHIAGYSRDGKVRGAAMVLAAFTDFTGIMPEMGGIDCELKKYSPLSEDYYNNASQLLLLLEKSRQFSADHKEFISTMNKNSKERAILFDKLRKEYPERHEIL